MTEDLFSYHYDSPIEELLGLMFGKYVNREICKITPQHVIKTSYGVFILDFLIEKGTRKYAIECDGQEFHDYYPDLYRDAILLGEGHINEMIRFRGKDLYSCLNVCMYFLAKLIHELVDNHFIFVLEQEARTEKWEKNRRKDPTGERFYEDIFEVEPNEVQEEYRPWRLGMEITRRHDKICSCPSISNMPEWFKAFSFIRQNNISTKDSFVTKFPARFS